MNDLPKTPIVSSHHLAEGEGWEVSEFEYALIVAYNGFSRWVGRCMVAAGKSDLSVLEILVLHHVNHRNREKKLADICFVLNIEDTHTVNYALRKLTKSGLVTSNKQGKEVFYSTSEEGAALCEEYRKVRLEGLLNTFDHFGLTGEELRRTAEAMRLLSGHYDQASRVAASF